jgi:hypothetical protein
MTTNATGLTALAGRQHPIGYHLAGQRITSASTTACGTSSTATAPSCAACPTG